MKKLLEWIKKPQLFQRIFRKMVKVFFFEQWVLLISSAKEKDEPDWRNFTPILPPKDRFWADPFIWKKDGTFYIFYEELLFSEYRGRIACMALNDKMQVESNMPVLEKPYHLSYPFLFKHNSQLYMLPETKENKRIELYRCRRFPDQWELDRVLIPDISAVDSTIVSANGKWWLFANVEEKDGSSWDSLHLFYANDLLSEEWTPHPKNPVVRNIKNARPAGRIFLREGDLIRPAQDCSVRYGYATNFNRITTLTETDYQEVLEKTFKPQRLSTYYATHTWNQSGDLRVIDALQWRRKGSSRKPIL